MDFTDDIKKQYNSIKWKPGLKPVKGGFLEHQVMTLLQQAAQGEVPLTEKVSFLDSKVKDYNADQ